jgi:NAD(P)-dependent dehydrogenase (short-subunit alcohol dehydrogenase family)
VTFLVTGTSSGIGRATAVRLAEHGYDVVAGVRRLADAPVHAGIRPVELDVTDPAQLAAVAKEIGPLRGVVNNAGITVAGPLEHLPLERLRQQLEINVMGVVAVSQAFLPAIRAGRGRLVMISSGSVVATPFWGAYSASKAAVVALSDAFRQELRPWGLPVVVVTPGAVRSPSWAKLKAAAEVDREGMAPTAERRYGPAMDAAARFADRLAAGAVPAERTATVIERALTDRSPRARYFADSGARTSVALKRLLPTSALDAVLARFMGLPEQVAD